MAIPDTDSPLDFPATAPVEIHTLLCHDHVPRYLLALRSLAMFWSDAAVVVHDDGTLTAEDDDRLKAEVPALHTISRAEADRRVASDLAAFPLVQRVRANNVRIRQLVDYFLLARAPRLIGMDSDILFLNRPDELVGTADPGAAPAVAYSPETGWQPKGIHWLPDVLPGEPYVDDMCCGLVSIDVASFLDLAHLESLMARIDPDILYRPRYVTQMLYSLMAGRLGPGRVASLGERYRSGRLDWLPDRPDRVICHYFGSHDGVDPMAGLITLVPPHLGELLARHAGR